MASSLFGWDLLYKTVEQDIKNNQDVLVCLTHFVLISNGFKCIGLGESKVLEDSPNKSEVLPKGWNDDYALRYVYQGRLYNLKATNLEDGVMINLIRTDERTVSLVQLDVRTVSSRSGTLSQMIPTHENVIDLIQKQLIDKVVQSKKSKETSSQTETAAPREQIPHSRFVEPYGISPQFQNPFRQGGPERNPALGRDDLDPLGVRGIGPFPPRGGYHIPPGGGGMLFEPPRPMFPGANYGIPPGSLPPGARFDPFRAPDERVRPRPPPNRPDNDEMPPPGYDDMFM